MIYKITYLHGGYTNTEFNNTNPISNYTVDYILDVIIKNQQLIWEILIFKKQITFTPNNIIPPRKNYGPGDEGNQGYLNQIYTNCLITSNIISYFLLNDKDRLLTDLISSRSELFLEYPKVDLSLNSRIIFETIQNTINNKYPQMAKENETKSLKKFKELKEKLKLEYEKDEIYIIYLFGRSFNLSFENGHVFVILKKQNSFNIYQSWAHQYPVIENLYENYEKLETIVLNKLEQGIKTIDGNYLSPINIDDHNTLSEIPGFVITPRDPSEGKPLLTFVSDEVSVDKHKFEEILSEINK